MKSGRNAVRRWLAATIATGAAAAVLVTVQGAAQARVAAGGVGAFAGTNIGTEYEHANRGGARWEAVVSGTDFTCTPSFGDKEAWVVSWQGSWWNDRVSSVDVEQDCAVVHFEHTYYGGDSTGLIFWYVPQISGGMNDKTSSLYWT